MVISIFIAGCYYIFEFLRNRVQFWFHKKGHLEVVSPAPQVVAKGSFGDIFKAGCERAKAGLSLSPRLGLRVVYGTKFP